jgi:simple sugar transport system substrate-binding protein
LQVKELSQLSENHCFLENQMFKNRIRFLTVLAVLALLMLSVLPSALLAQEVPEAFANEEAPTVIVVRQLADGAFMSRYLAGAGSMAEELGIDWREFNARGDEAEMVTQLENAISEQPDAILVSHGTSEAVTNLINDAVDQGIHVATFDTVVDNPAVPEIEQDDLRIGMELMKHVALETRGEANILYLNIFGFPPLDKRHRSYENFLWRYPGMQELVMAGAATESTAADTQTRVEALLGEYPEADVVVAMWDELAKGAVRAIDQSGMNEFVSVYAVDISDENISLMREDGSPWKAVVATDAYNTGRVGMRTAAALIGDEDPGKFILVEPALITRDFLLENDVTNMDELVSAMPELGESNVSWFPWMETLMMENGAMMPMVGGGDGGMMGSPIPADLSAFADAELPESFASDDAPRIIVVRQLADGAFMSRYLAGAGAMAEELGIDWVEFNARGDEAEMVTQLENAISEQPDGILVSHGTSEAVTNLINEAVDQGIAVATFDTVVDNPMVPEIEQDDLLIGYEITRHAALQNRGEANLIYLNIFGFPPLDKRHRTYEDVLWRYPGMNQQVMAGAATESTAADTQTRMEALLGEFPETDVVIAMWDELAKGAVRAIDQSGMSDFVDVYAVDVSDENIALMREDGSPWEAVVATDPYNAGRVGMRVTASLVGGEEPGKFILIPPSLITRDFLLENDVTNMDELVVALPQLGESDVAWYDWMFRLMMENGM